MSKLICDVCGTSYPETATQCPICGCVRPGEVMTLSDEAGDADSLPVRNYTYVKGGRFSKSNVRKRNKNTTTPVDQDPMDEPEEEESKKVDTGLTVAVIVLLVAIIAVIGYILVRIFGGSAPAPQTQPSTSAGESTVQTSQSTPAQILCEKIVVEPKEATFDRAGAVILLNVSTNPADTTEVLQFSSSDDTVATVSEKGKVTSVARGEAVITVTCGTATAQFHVICDFGDEATETTAAPTEAPAEKLELNRKEFSMFTKGETWTLYNGKIPADQIIWTSGNEKVVTVNKGVVKAVGAGVTYVYAEYAGTKVSCQVICKDSVGAYDEAVSQEPEEKPYTLNKPAGDVSINVGESFALYLIDANGNRVDVNWSSNNPAVCTCNGTQIQGVASGMTEVTVTYEGQVYSCIIRVR